MLEKIDIDKIEKINRDIMSLHEKFTSMDSKAYGAYLKLASHAMKDGTLPKMYKELIALGISAYINCEPCIVWHVREAVKSGATDAHVIEAIEVAMEMGGGPIVARSSFALKVLEYYIKDKA